jgi:hypothetical protein
MSCQLCEQEPCTCQKTLSPAPHLWIIQHCPRAGCTSAIRSRHGLPELAFVCKWCNAKEEQGCAFAVSPTPVPHEPAA